MWNFHQYLYNKQNITWPLGDTNFIFSCWKYFSLVRCAHSWEILSALVDKIRIAKRPCNILYIESGVHNQEHDISRWMLHNFCSLHLIYYIILYRLTVSAVQFSFSFALSWLLTLDSLLVFVSTKVLKCSKESNCQLWNPRITVYSFHNHAIKKKKELIFPCSVLISTK